jgi:hypothetical protein
VKHAMTPRRRSDRPGLLLWLNTTAKLCAVLELAKVQLIAAFDSFKTDVRIPWQQIPGNVPKVQHQVWVDALKETLKHHQQIEGLLS